MSAVPSTAEDGTDEVRTKALAEIGRLFMLDHAVRRLLAQRLDDVCWRDAYIELARLVGVEFKPELLPREAFLTNCDRFHRSLESGECYVAPVISEEEAVQLRSEIAVLRSQAGFADQLVFELRNQLRQVQDEAQARVRLARAQPEALEAKSC